MRSTYPLILAALALTGCQDDPAIVPGYLHLDEILVETDYSTYGTASSKITTAWIQVDGEYQGVYELPALIPLPFEGEHDLRIQPGINLNGIQSLRNIYEHYLSYEERINIQPNADIWLNAGNDSIPRTTYNPAPRFVYRNIEDFESVGLAFERGSMADTGLSRTTDPNLIFQDPKIVESNTSSGIVVLPDGTYLFEAVTIDEYTDLPKAGADVYLEMNYKSSLNIVVGVYRRIPGQTDQVSVVTLFPSPTWNKTYINLVTEVSAIPNAEGFKIFLGALKESNGRQDTLLFDNIKLLY